MNRLRNFLAAYRLYRRWNPLRVAIKAAWHRTRIKP
jgi:hypothetical protein